MLGFRAVCLILGREVQPYHEFLYPCSVNDLTMFFGSFDVCLHFIGTVRIWIKDTGSFIKIDWFCSFDCLLFFVVFKPK